MIARVEQEMSESLNAPRKGLITSSDLRIGPGNSNIDETITSERFSDEPIFEVENSNGKTPYFSLQLGYGNKPVEIFFETNGYGTNSSTPHIGIKLSKTKNPGKIIGYDGPVDGSKGEKFNGLGTTPGESLGDGQIVDAAYIAYVVDGELKINAIYYKKGARPLKMNLKPSKIKDNDNNDPEIEGIVNTLLQNKDYFLAKDSGIPSSYVDKYIKPVYDKLEELLPDKSQVQPKRKALQHTETR